MAVNKQLIQQVGFPDPLADDETKLTYGYGLQMGQQIAWEWFYRPESGGSCRYYDKRDKYHLLRLYGRGEQPTDIYKKLISGSEEGGRSYTNYDFRPLQIIPKFVKLIVNQMSERLFNVRCEATDKLSTDLRDRQKEHMENLMASKDMLQSAQQNLGVNLIENIDDVPDSQEEIELYMKLKYKPNIEIAAEEAIKYTLDLNDFPETQSRVIEDITTIGIGGVRTKTDSSKGIIVEYADPADMVYSFPENRDFKKVYYYGYVERVTIAELKRISGKQFTDEELRNLGQTSSEWNTYYGYSNTRTYREDDIDGYMVDILHFNYKTINHVTYKKKYNKNGGYKLTKKESTFDKKDPDYKGYDVVKKPVEVWLEGSLVLGTDLLFNYGLCENMVRKEGLLNKTLPNYIMYAPEIYQNRTKSLVERMVEYVDGMQQIHIKLQQLIAKARPSGIYIDVDGLSEIDLGDGNFLTPLELVKIYDETGNVLGTSINAEGEFNYGRQPIQELKNGVIDGLDRLIGAYNHYLNLLRDAIGIPAGADASLPHPDTLVGVQQQVALNSNTATRHILDAILNITERTSEGLALRLKDIFKYSNLKEAYTQAIGKINVGILDSIKKYHLHDFGINIELKPDIEEKQYLERNIEIALSKDTITVEDAIDIRNISNIKLANELLKIRRRKRQKEKQEEALTQIQANADANAGAAERSAQAKMQELEAKKISELEVQNAKSQGKIAELQAEKQVKSELMALEFTYQMQLKGVEVSGKLQAEQLKEGEKLRRQNINNTQASQMIDQRQKDKAPINFESSETNISGDVEISEVGLS